MNCEDSEISFAFIEQGRNSQTPFLQIKPLTVEFQRTKAKFDFARAKFSSGIAEHIEDAVSDDNGKLHRPRPVLVMFGDTAVHRLLYLPDGVTFGTNNVHIEFHDVRKYLDRGVVDYQKQNVTLQEAYRYIFNQRDKGDGVMFNGLDFAVPGSAAERVVSFRFTDGRLGGDATEYERAIDEYSAKRGLFGKVDKSEAIREYEQRENLNLIKSHYALDYKQVTPWEALLDMNEKFGVRTWVAPDGKLWVGSRGASGIDHIAAPDDSRVWKLIDYNITPPRDPIMKVAVRGKMVHDPNEKWGEQIGELLNSQRSTKDYRSEGVAERPDLDFGRIIEPEELGVSADGLQHIAERKLLDTQRDQWSGRLEILPSHSGSQWTDVRKVQIGDNILTVPPQNQTGECSTNIRQELFNVTGVTHTLNESAEWILKLDVTPIMDGYLDPDNVKSYVRYFDPSINEYVSEDAYKAKLGSEDDPDDGGFF
jgi:hypothetical protein